HRLRAEAAKGEPDQEVVPHGGDLQDQHDDQDVAGHRQDDLDEDAPEGAGIQHRRAHDLLRYPLVVIAEDQRQDGHGEDRVDQRDAQDRDVDLKPRRQDDQWNHDDLEWHEGAHEEDEEEGAGPADVPQGQRVAG